MTPPQTQHWPWNRYERGAGTVCDRSSTLRFALSGATGQQYSNAQIDDYQRLPRRSFHWSPPLQLSLKARFSHNMNAELDNSKGAVTAGPSSLLGTAGFGFWNDPFMMSGFRLPTLPRAVWFFYASPPSNMKLDVDTPGWGWKAATIDALTPSALWLAPMSPFVVLLNHMTGTRTGIWRSIQRSIHIQEAPLPVDMTQWHTYCLGWLKESTQFTVYTEQGELAFSLKDGPSPKGPLGFVMWMDNQYLIATPQGRIGWGLVDVPGQQWMETRELAIVPL